MQDMGAPMSSGLEGAGVSTVGPEKDEVEWQNVPYVNFNSDNGQVKLNANWHSNDNSNYSVPALRESSSQTPRLSGAV